MIRMIQSTSAAHAKSYFSEALSKADYYINDQELKGNIQGKLAERLGITGIATKEAFFALCDNVNPATGKRLTPLNQAKRTAGYDINFHCPKSVSILHALSGDNHIVDAFQQSVTSTMRHIELDMRTRVRANGQVGERVTGEAVWADFIHQTARPVGSHAPDPHLHAHCFVFNATWDEKEKKIKAGKFRDIKRDMPYYQARFHKDLSDRLIDLGYAIRLTEKSFEIEGVPKRVINLFSKRTGEIDRAAKEQNITDAKQRDALGARTRSQKQSGKSMRELRADWERQIDTLNFQEDDEKGGLVRFAPEKEKEIFTPKHCIDHALSHNFERASVIHDRRLLASAYRHAMGDKSVTIDGIDQCFKTDTRLIHVKDRGRTFNTTKQVLAEERHMVELARAGQGKLRPLYDKAPRMDLKGQQAQAVEHILTTTDRVSIIRGVAGSGKTTLMKEAVKHLEWAGKAVTVVAPSSQASRGVLKQEGFENAQTVAQLLVDEKMQKQLKNQVLWVDEAGLLGTRDMIALLTLAHKQEARLVLGGDTRQHSSVVRGDALRILNTVGGIKSAEINKIYRQRNETYRSIVEDLSNGNVTRAFDKLDKAKAIHEMNPKKPHDDLVREYVQTLNSGKSALIISPTHEQGRELTASIRSELRKSGFLGKKEIQAKRLSNLNLTEAQKADWRNLHEGHVVQFNQNRAGIGRGSLWRVTASADNNVFIKKDGENEAIPLPMDHSNSYDVFKETTIALSKGDIVRITRNGFDNEKKRMNNGQILQVESVKKDGNIVLWNPTSKAKYQIDRDFSHLAASYVLTSFAAQGSSCSEVFLYQPAATFPATDSKQLYVSVSRGRDAVRIYTDDKKELLENAKKIGDRRSAIDLVTNNDQVWKNALQQVRHLMNRLEPRKQIEPVDIHKPIHVTKNKDYEPGI